MVMDAYDACFVLMDFNQYDDKDRVQIVSALDLMHLKQDQFP